MCGRLTLTKASILPRDEYCGRSGLLASPRTLDLYTWLPVRQWTSLAFFSFFSFSFGLLWRRDTGYVPGLSLGNDPMQISERHDGIHRWTGRWIVPYSSSRVLYVPTLLVCGPTFRFPPFRCRQSRVDIGGQRCIFLFLFLFFSTRVFLNINNPLGTR